MLRLLLLAVAVAAAPSADLPSLLGRTPAQLDTKFGAPTVLTIPAETLGPVVATRGYGLPDGGTLDVDFCGSEAYGFRLNAGTAYVSAHALLMASGFDPERFPVVEGEEGFEQRGGAVRGRRTTRLTVLAGPSGWRTLVVAFEGTPCTD